MPETPKVKVEMVEAPVDLSPATIDALTEVGKGIAGDHPRAGRAGETAAEEAASDHIKVSTIKTISTPHSQEEDSLTAKGQRRINLTWEYTQAAVTILIVLANVAAAFVPLTPGSSENTLTNAMFVVLGFYYGRTNHQKVGGVTQGR